MRIRARGWGVALVWGILASSIAAQASACSSNAVGLAHAGGALNDEQARALEAALQAKPDDLAARSKLLGYYSLRASQSSEARRSKQAHVLWLAQHHPEAEIASTAYAALYAGFDGEAYDKAKVLWLEQAKQRATNVRVLDNAARFVQFEDAAKAEELWLQAQALEPSSSHWPTELGHLYKRRLVRLERDQSVVAAKALQYFERALEVTDSRDTILGDAATVALEAGDAAKANAFALELLASPAEGWNSGNALHHGNLVLGRLALQAGNLPEARQYLLKAGRTRGSPQLNSFGPNMRLAKELLAKGERDAVVEYLQLCARFWEMGAEEIANWTATIRRGSVPDFGANLDY